MRTGRFYARAAILPLDTMRQLTVLDQQILALEDSRHYGHVGGLAILDPATAPGGELTILGIQRLIAERLSPTAWASTSLS